MARFLAERTTAAGGRVDATRVAFASYEPYIGLFEALKRAGLAAEPRAAGKWLTSPAPYFVVPEWYATAIRRDRRDPAMLRDLDALDAGAHGYRPILDLPVEWYLQQAVDRWLDPGLAYTQGAFGFRVYARE